jgi:hypothetical protein
MEPRIEIRRLQLDYRVPPSLVAGGGGDLRARLDEVAARVLPVLLERALAPLDDGRLVVLRRVSSHVRLGALAAAGEVMPWATRWAESLAAEVRRAVDEAIASGGAVTENATVFAGPVEAIAHYVVDALAGRLDRWCWRPSLGVLATARRALDDTVSSGGDPHRQALATPTGAATAEAVEWALVASGGALPSLVADLARTGCAARALALVSGPVALRLLAALGSEAAASSSVGPAFASLHRLALGFAEWPVVLRASRVRDGNAGGIASPPDPDDPRNLLLLVALAVADRPDLRGAAHLLDDARSAIGNRADAGRPQASVDPRASDPRSSARPEQSPEDRVEGPSRLRADTDAAPTGYAGLLFLLPLVSALEIDRAILDEPLLSDAPGLLPILYHVAVRLAPEAWADPVALALADSDAPPFAWGGGEADRPDAPEKPVMDEARAAAVLRAEARVVAAAHRHGLAAGADVPAEQAAIAALRARAEARLPASLVLPAWLDELCTRFAARIAGLLRLRLGPLEEEHNPDPGFEAVLIRVIARSGRIVRTRTHLDVLLPLDGVDLDVRRAALDVDPGWVPFLGRIVRFHHA